MKKRFYRHLLIDHFEENRQMLFLMGPRQVGKTTICQTLEDSWDPVVYYSWDTITHRESILEGPDQVAKESQLQLRRENNPILIFDEIHKFQSWKTFLKGLYDTYPSMAHILVTGSARLDTYKKGGDSLMGRYFMYRIHPLSVAELLHQKEPSELLRPEPTAIDDESFQRLCLYSGFPDPFLKGDNRFYQRWKHLRTQQLFNEDVRDLTRVQEIDRLEILAELLRRQVGQQLSYTSFAKKVRVTDKTIRQWLGILRSLYYCFEVRPWSKNLAHAILKEPKYYLWDWANCDDEGQRAENMVASHLLKAVHFWTDHGLGDFGLYYLRDKQKREVDFVVTKNDEPWFLVEVKRSESRSLSPSLEYYHNILGTKHALQVAMDMPYVDRNCFESRLPMIVSARSFLSQLI